jgi:hypothetical protein
MDEVAKKNALKAAIILIGGFAIFMLLKPKQKPIIEPVLPTVPKAFDSNISSAPVDANMEDANIVASAYSEALRAGEPPSKLLELNKELVKDFGMKCYVDKEGKLIVCDSNGSTVIAK